MNPLDLDRQLCFALYSASRAMTASYKDLLAELGITYPQYLVMLVLWENGAESDHPESKSAEPDITDPEGVTVKRLGERLQLDSGTLSPLLSRLEKLGFITRHRSAEDSRSVFVRPTAAGAAAKERAECVPARIGARTQLDPDALPVLLETLRTLTGNLRGDHAPTP
ncbi:MarR family winged helix-turn-helix transcriptional regulator [Brevibacterium atlanticum]|uniref:MarR family winged helix-turn-helix transcriptional regulator n=1 Tax=Brevibacterium atlanticum TaxID=2697563 RepID=UPI00141FD980|nr:MarR family transcriptional regulator [Brevibacterium atlanticum]